mmetsp:Transcript_29169/g.67786  ORF Transcript_29169/g.67786 Transcript_29169/m.67786 type:complete len:89 (-) Transcript_29169:70-336(-)
MWDNLPHVHDNAEVFNVMDAAGHRVLARPKYRPQDGPIEYVFNQLQRELSKIIHTIANEHEFVQAITTIITNITGASIDATFVHCGYA